MIYLLACLLQVHCLSAQKTTGEEEPPIAFPGAEGFGKYATGGRGGQVILVTNLNDEGEGSFRKAATAKGSRVILFQVSGTIHLLTPLTIKGDVTIAGHSAPGDGICIADRPVFLGGDNIIIRYLRFRLGDRFQTRERIPGAGHDDALNGKRRKHILIDHCSISWSTDECFSIYAGDSSTLQWNIISEPLNFSYFFEVGDKDYQHHGYGALWGGKHLSAHHNLFAHCLSRTPRIDGIRNNYAELVDYRNNVIYNWGINNVYGGEGGNYNITDNYYKAGASTSEKVRGLIVNPTKREPDIGFGKFYVKGNHVEGFPDVTNNNVLGVHMGAEGTEDNREVALVALPFETVAIRKETALQAFESVLKGAGASLRRDTLDERIARDVRNGTGKFIDVQGGYAHGTPYELTVNAWPTLVSWPAPIDADRDGMPDDWERGKGLDPLTPNSSGTDLHHYYTNIEVYLNELAK